MVIELLLQVGCALVLVTIIQHVYRNLCKMPPGPPPLPIIGNLHQLGVMVHEHFHKLGKKYGPVMRVLIGSEMVIVVTGVDEVLEGLISKSSDFAGRKLTYTLSLTSSGGKGLAFADYTKKLILYRKIVHGSMKMYGNGVTTIEALVTKQTTLMYKRFDELVGTPVNLHYDISLVVINVVMAMIFGKQYEKHDKEFRDIIQSNTMFVKAFEYDSFIDVFPILRLIPSKRINQLQAALGLRNPIIKKHLMEHKFNFKKNREGIQEDLCYALLETLKTAEEEDEHIRHYFDDDGLIAILDDMVGSGTETTSTVIRWSVVYLIHHNDIQQKCYEQIMNVMGAERLPKLQDKEKLPLVNAFILETLRMSSIAPMAVPHKATCNSSIGGFDITKDTQVIFNLYSLHRNETEWKDPYTFNPYRFIDKNGELFPIGHYKAFLPFSAGRRCCLAESLAKMELFLVISHMIARYKFSKVDDQDRFNMNGVPGLFLSPEPHKILISKR